MSDVLRVASDDILYRLRAEERERAEAIRIWRANACGGSIRDDSHNITNTALLGENYARERLGLQK